MPPPFRPRLRHLLALVAVAALALGVKVGLDRRRAFRVRAITYALLATRGNDLVDLEEEPDETLDHLVRRLQDRPPDPRHLALQAYYRSLQAKYEAAAARPWLAIPPDQPAPD